MPFDQPFPSLPSALTVLTSMITPALLISATGTFILSTSNRLGRVVDRVRVIAEKMDGLIHASAGLEMIDQRKAMLVQALGQLSQGADLLWCTLNILYPTSGPFAATSRA